MGFLDDVNQGWVKLILFISLLVGVQFITGTISSITGINIDLVSALTGIIAGVFGAFGLVIGTISTNGLILLALMIPLVAFGLALAASLS